MKSGAIPCEECTNASRKECNCITFASKTSKYWERHGLTQYIWCSARKLRRGAYLRIGRQVVLTIQICRSSHAVFQGARGNDEMTIWSGSYTLNSILQAIGFGQLAWIFATQSEFWWVCCMDDGGRWDYESRLNMSHCLPNSNSWFELQCFVPSTLFLSFFSS